MKIELHIAQRFLKGGSQKKSTGLMVSISIFGIALSLSVMIIAMAVTGGFKREISMKATGFAADIQITALDSQYSLYNTLPISASQPFTDELKALPEVRHVQTYCVKPGIMKSAGEVQGIVLKGVGKDFEWDFFRKNLREGQLFHVTDSAVSDRIVLSRHIARLLQLKPGDAVIIHFVQNPMRMRRFTVSGIYETGLTEFDKVFALVDMAHLQRLNNWSKEQVSGFEIFVRRFDRLEATTDEVFNLAGFRIFDDGSGLKVENVRERYSQLFDWLSLQDATVFIILLLMILVAGFNMISGLLIVILERTSTIGILKALGADNRFIRKVFLYEAAFFTGKGLLWGNVIALTLCWLQWQFGVISLDQESYFLEKAPVYIHPLQLLAINITAAAAILLMLLVPSSIISRISPDTSIKYH
ncbi:MAG: FtsX-like permease family protein [Bacteroidales bacterium]|nr:FtsX-like permease family protein [Bacteroidales bacterium]